jgi:NADP-dependent 3-hydroxy acid dehydrogenase YdfG/acyl carrier protein
LEYESLYTMRWRPVPVGPERSVRAVRVGDSDWLGRAAPDVVADLAALRSRLDRGEQAPDVVLVACGCPAGAPGEDVAGAVRAATRRVLAAIRDWGAEPQLSASRLVFVTSGAVAVDETEPLRDHVHAACLGMVRSAQTEFPDRFVLVDTDSSDASLTRLASAATLGEAQLALREGTVRLPRWGRVTVPAQSTAPIWGPDGTVLVTGGTGAIAAVLVRHLVREHGVRHLVLTSRSGPAAPGAAELHDELVALGAQVTVAACDVADRDALRRLIDGIPAEHPLTAVVHSAGVLADGVVESLTDEQLDTVLRPKVDAALHLHELTADLDLSAFVLFSSVAAVFGGAGQANYAAGNAFLDALARTRRDAGLPGTSIQWGLWVTEGGMTGGLSTADLDRIARGGIRPFAAGGGEAAFDAALAAEQPVVAPIVLDLDVLAAQPVPDFLRDVVPAPVRRAAGGATATPSAVRDLRQQLRELPARRRERVLLDLVRAEIATVLGFAEQGAVPLDRGLLELGFDSLTAVELRNRLGQAAGLRLPATLLFDHPTARAIAAHIGDQVLPDDVADPVAVVEDDLEQLLAASSDQELFDLIDKETGGR